jgi:hypothetical protein
MRKSKSLSMTTVPHFRDRDYPARKWIRLAVFVMGGLHTAAVFAVVIAFSGQLVSAEGLSRSLAWYALVVYGGPYVLCALPALILAALNRHLRVALALCILALVFTLVLWHL